MTTVNKRLKPVILSRAVIFNLGIITHVGVVCLFSKGRETF